MMGKFGGYGFNKSLHEASRIPTYSQDGSFAAVKLISDIVSGDLVRTRDERTGEDLLVPVVTNHDHGELELIEVVFDDGSVAKCTPDHKFRTTTGEMLPIKEIIVRGLEVVSAGSGLKATPAGRGTPI